jgi:hypothetical protein
LGVALLENCPSKPREQQVWSLRLAEKTPDGGARPAPAVVVTSPTAGPRIVEDAVVSVRSPTRVELEWKAPVDESVAGYHVERAAVEVYSEDQLVRLKKQTPPLAEPSVGAIRRIGPFTRLNAEPVISTTFVDSDVDLKRATTAAGEPVYEQRLNLEQFDASGRPYRFAVYAYRIRAVTADGIASGPSPPFFTIPSSPQFVFSREEGATCHLRWVANPEAGIKGYRVYRMDGRYDKDPISRLTADPSPATNHTDTSAGKHSRRYYIVAVDAISQEGFPSAPVWFEREWKQYYRPFVAEWHQ